MVRSVNRILLLDDDEDICECVSLMLENAGYRTECRLTVESGLEYLEEHPDTPVVFLDMMFENSPMNGLDGLKAIKSKYPFTQVIMLTGETKLDAAVECMKRGALDYCVKLPTAECVVEKASGALAKHAAARNAEDELKTTRDLALKDALTGVYNRGYFDAYMAKIVSRQPDSPMCMLMVDIDHFKAFNDLYGHQVGDRVLKHLADHLMRMVKGGDFVARYGGEEFAILLHDITLENAGKIAEKIREKIAESPFLLREGKKTRELTITVSIGVSELRKGVSAGAELIKRSDMALYRAKNGGRNQVCVFDDAWGEGQSAPG